MLDLTLTIASLLEHKNMSNKSNLGGFQYAARKKGEIELTLVLIHSFGISYGRKTTSNN